MKRCGLHRVSQHCGPCLGLLAGLPTAWGLGEAAVQQVPHFHPRPSSLAPQGCLVSPGPLPALLPSTLSQAEQAPWAHVQDQSERVREKHRPGMPGTAFPRGFLTFLHCFLFLPFHSLPPGIIKALEAPEWLHLLLKQEGRGEGEGGSQGPEREATGGGGLLEAHGKLAVSEHPGLGAHRVGRQAGAPARARAPWLTPGPASCGCAEGRPSVWEEDGPPRSPGSTVWAGLTEGLGLLHADGSLLFHNRHYNLHHFFN